jgi:xylan 1,4-beta-xylosidase
VSGLDGARQLREWRVDAAHGDVATRWAALGGSEEWPTEEQWKELVAGDRLDESAPARTVTPAADGTVTVELDLPMPGIVFLSLG